MAKNDDRFSVKQQSSHQYSMMFLALWDMRAGAGESTQDRPPQTPTPGQSHVSFRLREEKVGGGGRGEVGEGAKRARISLNTSQHFQRFSRSCACRVGVSLIDDLRRARDDKGDAARCRRAMNDRIRIYLRTPVPTAPRPRPRPRTGSASSAPREVRHAVRGLGVHGQTSAGAPNSGVRDHDAGGELRPDIPHSFPPPGAVTRSTPGRVRKARRKGPSSDRYADTLSERIALARAPLAV